VDTAILQKEANTPWYIGYMATKNNPDSVITLQYETTETTVDSCRKKFVFQVSYADSPTSWGPDDSWVNFYSVTADSSASDFVRFVPNRYGVPYKLRVLVIETDANKDAVQTSTVRIIFPKFADL